MKRLGLGFAGAALLILVLPMTLSSCAVTCGCASTADPNWTPLPEASGLAAQDAARIAGVSTMAVELVPGPEGRLFYRATSPGVIAVVDAVSGTVLEVVFIDLMPGTVAPSTPTPTDGPTDNDARRAAEAFMTGRGIEFEGFIESSAFRTVAGTSTYDITWTKISGGARYSFYEVSVNALTGNVYAFLNLRLQLPLTTPVLGRLGAITLVTEKLGVDASEATSAELAVDFSSGVVAWTWNIRLGTTLVRMDAATGVGTTVGSESPAPSS